MISVKFEGVTLEPLRQKGSDALDVQGIPGLEQIELEELKSEWYDRANHVVVLEADDLLRAPAPDDTDFFWLLPKHAIFTFARLLFHFASTARTAIVEIRPPDTITFDPDCPLSLIARWLLKYGFAIDLQEETP